MAWKQRAILLLVISGLKYPCPSTVLLPVQQSIDLTPACLIIVHVNRIIVQCQYLKAYLTDSVARAVLQSPPSLINLLIDSLGEWSFSQNISQTHSIPNQQS